LQFSHTRLCKPSDRIVAALEHPDPGSNGQTTQSVFQSKRSTRLRLTTCSLPARSQSNSWTSADTHGCQHIGKRQDIGLYRSKQEHSGTGRKTSCTTRRAATSTRSSNLQSVPGSESKCWNYKDPPRFFARHFQSRGPLAIHQDRTGLTLAIVDHYPWQAARSRQCQRAVKTSHDWAVQNQPI
jgi:hypothetical protein